jgi:hypothetical protein
VAISGEARRELFKRAAGRCERRMSVCSHHRAGQRCPHGLYSGSREAYP